jgi:predicted transposase YbfD/YdcC
MSPARESLVAHFSILRDPRVDRTKRHLLIDIVVIAVCAVLSGAETWEDMELYGESKEALLRTFLELPNGIASHDTTRRVFCRLDPEAFQACFLSWAEAMRARGGLPRGQVAIDGKTLRGSRDRATDTGPLHMVSAWAVAAHLVLGQLAVEAKSNEITAIPELLDLLDLKGCTVTIDAQGCQKAIAERIVAKEADYVLALKANHPTMHGQVAAMFEMVEEDASFDVPRDVCETSEVGHGREERRRVTVLGEVEVLEGADGWAGLESVAMVERWRREGEKESYERHYYLTSLPLDARQVGEAVRGHWGIENSLHWVLDVAFREDASRVRTGFAPENLATLRHLAVSLIKQERATKGSVRGKRHRAAWDDTYLLKILGVKS